MRNPLSTKKRSIPKKTFIDVALHAGSIRRPRANMKFIVTWYWTTDTIATQRMPCSAG